HQQEDKEDECPEQQFVPRRARLSGMFHSVILARSRCMGSGKADFRQRQCASLNEDLLDEGGRLTSIHSGRTNLSENKPHPLWTITSSVSLISWIPH
ncbi:MAG: hypothetical protein AB1813_27550, partial [Verrucomicrobiota bacterium]